MRWFEDIPTELRLQVYRLLCESTTVVIHSKCHCRGRNGKYKPLRGAVAFLCSSKAALADFGPVFRDEAIFMLHTQDYNPPDPLWVARGLHSRFFNDIEERELSEFFVQGHMRLWIDHRDKDLLAPRSIFNVPSARFTVTDPLGQAQTSLKQIHETQKLFSLIQYCRGRVEMLEFWWHHASSKRNDPVVPWHVCVDSKSNFVIKGPNTTGFRSLQNQFLKLLKQSLISGITDNIKFTFVQM
ncbi:unnamed protein product [Clonostachys byssicola]|uniref:Uncharacterized protein n=1 Tax=Clonostachys byssicola TaxID=160290 RepID=A0A9N9UYW7_9HYPO|nr:unnamed protein product [Clonostachys byssicola]